MAAIRRDFLPADLEPILRQNGVSGTVVVQADQTLAETDWLLGLADRYDFIHGVVGWIDLRADELPAQLDDYTYKPSLKGFRHVVQAETDPLFMLRPDFIRGVRQIVERGYTYDILIVPHQLGQALELLRLFPRGRFVIDHLAKPYIAAGLRAGWEAGIRALANYENCYCKVSGMVTEAGYTDWTPDQLRPYLDTVFDAFGPDRLMFGSDWPVCRVASDYGEWKDVLTAYLGQFSVDELSRVMGGTASEFYNLGPTGSPRRLRSVPR
jgi:L-fuconolactonase